MMKKIFLNDNGRKDGRLTKKELVRLIGRGAVYCDSGKKKPIDRIQDELCFGCHAH